MGYIDTQTFEALKARMQARFPVLIEGYLKDGRNYIEISAMNISPQGDVAEVIHAAHSLKSASGLLGLMDVHKAAEKLEYAAKDLQENGAQDTTALAPLHDTLDKEFHDIANDVRARA